MRTITSHLIEGSGSNYWTVQALDEPGPGRANHVYRVVGVYEEASGRSGRTTGAARMDTIMFQNGGVAQIGTINGLTNEALLAIVLDRLEGFQSGPYQCDDNADALACVRDALLALQRRTRKRLAQGVDGWRKAHSDG